MAMRPPRTDIIPVGGPSFRRAAELELLGIKPADAVHVAAAESQRADAFLTCDDRLVNSANRRGNKLGVRVANPVIWIHDHDQG